MKWAEFPSCVMLMSVGALRVELLHILAMMLPSKQNFPRSAQHLFRFHDYLTLLWLYMQFHLVPLFVFLCCFLSHIFTLRKLLLADFSAEPRKRQRKENEKWAYNEKRFRQPSNVVGIHLDGVFIPVDVVLIPSHRTKTVNHRLMAEEEKHNIAD